MLRDAKGMFVVLLPDPFKESRLCGNVIEELEDDELIGGREDLSLTFLWPSKASPNRG